VIKKIYSHLKTLQNKKNLQNNNISEEYKDLLISNNIDTNLDNLKKILGKSFDVTFREYRIGFNNDTRILIAYINGLIENTLVVSFVNNILSLNFHKIYDQNLLKKDIFTFIKEKTLNAIEVEELYNFNDLLYAMLSGNTIMFIDGYKKTMDINIKGWPSRNIEEPPTEAAVKGPREGFTENIITNTALMRRRLKNPNLRFEHLEIGEKTYTEVIIGYIKGVADEKIINEVRKRLNKIDINMVLESGYIEQSIEDHPYSPFSTIGYSEKPDKITAKLLEGKIAILCDGTPFVLTLPYLFIEIFQSTEDYYARPYISTVMRILRYLAFLITILLPSIYIALETFHQEMIPSVLVITFAAAREGIPFPTFLETLIATILFELLRESGIRMPRPIGQTVSIVGALIIGEAAVKAGLIGSPAVIIIALVGITGFIVPAVHGAVVIIRLFLMILAGAFGLFGVIMGLFVVIAHASSLRSFGIPFLTPLAPLKFKWLKDTFIRVPFSFMNFGKINLKESNRNTNKNNKRRYKDD
jgi:spore germination protein KA